MKRVLIGGFLSLIGSIWSIVVGMFAMKSLVSSWSTPPGRFVTTIISMGVMPLFAASIAFVLLGVVIMAVEYFRKES